MQLTIELLKRTTFFLFICFLIQEAISMICLLIFGHILLDDNKANIDKISIIYLLEISNSFNNIFVKQLDLIQSDLSLIYSHANIFDLLQNESLFYKSFQTPLINNVLFKSSDVYQQYKNTDATSSGSFMIFTHLIKKYQSLNPFDESKHIENLFNEIGLRTATFYIVPNSLIIPDGTMVNYLISILKAITIRDFNLNKIPNKYSLITKSVFYVYPANIIEFNNGLNDLFYDSTLFNCRIIYQPECITNFMLTPPFNGQIYNNTVFFNHPKLRQNNTIGQACINLPLVVSTQSIICSYFQYSKIDFNIPLLNHAVDFALIGMKETNQGQDIEILYLIDTIYDQIRSSFSNNRYKQFAFNSTQSSFSLFHLLYYHMFQNVDIDKDFIDEIIEEYLFNLKLILPTVSKYLNTIKHKNQIDIEPLIFNVTQTYIYYSRTQEGNLYHPSQNIFKDEFHYLIKPIVVETSNEKENTNRFICFSFVAARNEVITFLTL